MELARIVASMPCFIAFIRADSFAEGIEFVDYFSSLKGNPMKNKKKYLIIMTPTIDHSLLQNKTDNTNVYVINQDEAGRVVNLMCGYTNLLRLFSR